MAKILALSFHACIPLCRHTPRQTQCMHTYIHTYKHTNTMHMHAHMHTYEYVHIHKQHVRTYKHIYLIYTHTCVPTHVCIHKLIQNACPHMSNHTCTSSNMQIYMQTYTHSETCTYICTSTQIAMCSHTQWGLHFLTSDGM